MPNNNIKSDVQYNNYNASSFENVQNNQTTQKFINYQSKKIISDTRQDSELSWNQITQQNQNITNFQSLRIKSNQQNINTKIINQNRLDFQFKKSGTIVSNVNFPWNPIIQKCKNLPDPLHKKGKYTVIINQIKKKYGNFIDCPVYLIKKINSSNKYELNDIRKSLYYKALFQETTLQFPNINLTYDYMYRKYFDLKNLDEYTLFERIFIEKCKNNNTLLIDLYKREYIRFSLH